jgi:dephospho-CoA kinase
VPSEHPTHNQTAPASTPRPPLVIGLAGGIGSGKSSVAAAFARLGCAVIDSDREAKAALDRPEVLATLKQWWGAGVVAPDGTADRAAIGRIVFADPAQRTRLENLIHPLIRRTRAQAQAEARAVGAPAILYDAPLLFEAGLDALCDAVIWVECPREERLRRVMASRGWDDAELAKREAAQWPNDMKRAKCSHEIWNGAVGQASSLPLGGMAGWKPAPPIQDGKAPVSPLDVRAAELLAILLCGQASDGGRPRTA